MKYLDLNLYFICPAWKQITFVAGNSWGEDGSGASQEAADDLRCPNWSRSSKCSHRGAEDAFHMRKAVTGKIGVCWTYLLLSPTFQDRGVFAGALAGKANMAETKYGSSVSWTAFGARWLGSRRHHVVSFYPSSVQFKDALLEIGKASTSSWCTETGKRLKDN